VNKVKRAEADHFVSDCPMAAEQIAQEFDAVDANNPMSLLRSAYGI
jgi:glycerol-3-phosphate dehydrogenase subunit C